MAPYWPHALPLLPLILLPAPPPLPPRPQVSCHTGRVHLHLSPDGRRPAGLSLPLELLLAAPASQLLRGILAEHSRRYGGRWEGASRGVEGEGGL